MKPRIAIPVPNSTDINYVMRALPQYEHAIREAGGEPVIIDVKATLAEIAQQVKTCDGVLLPGSPADVDPEKYGAARHPKTAAPDTLRDNTDELLLQDAYNMRKPIFGICYGLQSLNVWRTGSLDQDLSTGVNHDPDKSVVQAHLVQHRSAIEAGCDSSRRRSSACGCRTHDPRQLQSSSGRRCGGRRSATGRLVSGRPR